MPRPGAAALASLKTLFETKRGKVLRLPPNLARLYGCLRMPAAARAGYRYRSTGENIAAGQIKPEDAVAGWVKNAPHCANLMNPAFTEMGVAFAVDRRSEMGVYWTQAFGRPR